jgi:diadenosine tetraphosphate (Ap4A) HIT family hydrolase
MLGEEVAIMTCIFCEILEGRMEGSFARRGERVSAFMDLAQWTPGHLLVVPNVHAALLAELDPRLGGEIFEVGMRLANALRRSSLSPTGINFHLADGETAGQEILHVHLHVIPRSAQDGFGIRCVHLGRAVERALLDQRAEELRTIVERLS